MSRKEFSDTGPAAGDDHNLNSQAEPQESGGIWNPGGVGMGRDERRRTETTYTTGIRRRESCGITITHVRNRRVSGRLVNSGEGLKPITGAVGGARSGPVGSMTSPFSWPWYGQMRKPNVSKAAPGLRGQTVRRSGIHVLGKRKAVSILPRAPADDAHVEGAEKTVVFDEQGGRENRNECKTTGRRLRGSEESDALSQSETGASNH